MTWINTGGNIPSIKYKQNKYDRRESNSADILEQNDDQDIKAIAE